MSEIGWVASGPMTTANTAGERAAPCFSVAIETLDAARPAWVQLEQDGILTPYQRLAWSEAHLRHVDGPAGLAGHVLTVRDPAGAPVMLMPFVLVRCAGIGIAIMPGGKQANFHMPLFRAPLPRWRDEDVVELLSRAARSAPERIDLFRFDNQPVAWQGHANPFALRGVDAPSHAYKLALEPGADVTTNRVLGRDTRRKLRQKRRRFEAQAELRHVLARNDADRRMILDAFYVQKAARMAQWGVADPFGAVEVKAFIDEATRLDRGIPPAIDLHGLVLGGRVVATFAGAPGNGRLSGMFNSFDLSPEIARNSPGDLLLIDVIEHYAAAGFTAFDLGIGEARYKEVFCDEPEIVVDSLFPVTPKGRAAAVMIAATRAGKRRIKRSPRLMRLLGRRTATGN